MDKVKKEQSPLKTWLSLIFCSLPESEESLGYTSFQESAFKRQFSFYSRSKKKWIDIHLTPFLCLDIGLPRQPCPEEQSFTWWSSPHGVRSLGLPWWASSFAPSPSLVASRLTLRGPVTRAFGLPVAPDRVGGLGGDKRWLTCWRFFYTDLIFKVRMVRKPSYPLWGEMPWGKNSFWKWKLKPNIRHLRSLRKTQNIKATVRVEH